MDLLRPSNVHVLFTELKKASTGKELRDENTCPHPKLLKKEVPGNAEYRNFKPKIGHLKFFSSTKCHFRITSGAAKKSFTE